MPPVSYSNIQCNNNIFSLLKNISLFCSLRRPFLRQEAKDVFIFIRYTSKSGVHQVDKNMTNAKKLSLKI